MQWGTKMKKALFVTHNSRFLVQFEMNDIRILQTMGLEVQIEIAIEIACGF